MTKDEVLNLALEVLEYIDLCDNDRDFLHPHEMHSLPAQRPFVGLDKETQTIKLMGLIDGLIEVDPDRAERFIESILARHSLQKRLREKNAP